MSIDDYLDGLLSGSSEPSRKAIMKLTKLIENFGGIMVKSTERMEDYVAALDARIAALEQALGVAPARPSPTFAASPAVASAPAPAAAPAVAKAAPNLSAAPAGDVGAPNLSAAPAGDVGAPSLAGGDAPIPAPAGSQGNSGGGISSSDLMKAASNLQKAPVREPGEPGAPGEPGMGPASTISPFGASASDIRDTKSGLTKVDPDEHRKERAAAQTGGSMPAGMALNLEVKEELAKRSSRASEDGEDEEELVPTQAAPAAPGRSTKQMKEALQGELRDAFSSLLESDDEEE